MKSNFKSQLLTGLVLGGLLWSARAASAQTVIPATGGRLAVVDIKDSTLKDALDLIFDSAGIKSRSIDASASAIVVPNVVRSNIAWDDLVRSLCLTYDYRFSRNRDGLYVIEPRKPVGLVNPGEGGNPGFQGGRPSTPGTSGRGGGTAAPANPFGFGGTTQTPRNRGNQLMTPPVETRSNAQTTPRGGTARGGTARGGAATDEPLKYTIVRVKHVYSGGIAQLFSGGSIIYSDQFVTPGQTSSSSSSGNGNGTTGGLGVNGGIGVSTFGGNSGGSSGGFGSSGGNGGGFGSF